ncbi:YlbF family regulator [Alicyclobacillus cycloheptanicus]|uniref:UPF0342 protein J2S03_003370 n=1 Tax=Alicyclobacillus cycloheptanicus TaxID=1457 RepID=A0ABT9XMF4_9BACL|nr:YlbF family regulator [Alicyclobacillus cycloheptanicus]MDQ0191499.1 cell fate (sporulation/competence/biofilm development) regulator YlbF (YheA/YmcA/DUF963 family) [Alicyclobacillus cycloheptanicus]WDM01903.1 YlbF family regulator [Alicyclobacillus cycloheptanicus]
MVNPYDKAYELADALRQSDAFQRLRDVKQKIEADPAVLEMLQDYRKRQMELEQKQMLGQTLTEEERSAFEKLTEVVNLNMLVRNYLEGERQLGVIFWDIQGILAKVMQEAGIQPPLADEASGSTGAGG